MRCSQARRLVQHIPRGQVVLPAQALGEMFAILVRKAGCSKEAAALRLGRWAQDYAVAPTSHSVLDTASALAARHGFQIWDAVILAAAAEAGCALLLSEDMQHGFAWGGVTVVNPFAASEHPLLTRALAS